MTRMPVLMVGFEMAPFYKGGGLGDVMASLPKSLSTINVDVRVVMPYYKVVREKFNSHIKRIGEFSIHFGKGEESIGVYETFLPDTKIIVYFLSNKISLPSPHVRGRNKSIDQFAFFDLAVSHLIPWLSRNKSWTPKLIHLNDWHTALIPLLLQKKAKTEIPTLLTIHNLNYQGIGSMEAMDLLHITDEETKQLKKGVPVTSVNLLGEGIMHATKVSTVSPTYAKEIYADYKKDQIHYFLDQREKDRGKKDTLIGILNGIDYSIWSPENDNLIFHKYNNQNWEEGKKNNKEDLLKALELEDKPTFCFIGRMVSQKGIDILLKAIKKMGKIDFNLIFLGEGQANIEKSIEDIVRANPKNIKALFSYSEEMAHKLHAACDFVLMPSHYEPCGLIQMVAMKYGAIPIGAKTGGLVDSIEDGQNGLLFKRNSVSDFVRVIREALRIYENKKHLKFMIMRALKADFSWQKSALLYKKLYEDIESSKNS